MSARDSAPALRRCASSACRSAQSRAGSRADDPPFGALGYGTPDDLPWMPTVNARVLSGPTADGRRVACQRARSSRAPPASCAGAATATGCSAPSTSTRPTEQVGLAALAQRAYRDLFEVARTDAAARTCCASGTTCRRSTPTAAAWSAIGSSTWAASRPSSKPARPPSRARRPPARSASTRARCASASWRAARRRVPVENPRQVSAYRYPPTYGPRVADLLARGAGRTSAAATIALFISGTASIVGHETVHQGDVRAQTRRDAAQPARRDRRGQRAQHARASTWLGTRLRGLRAPRRRRRRRSGTCSRRALGADAHRCATRSTSRPTSAGRDLLVEIEAHAVATGRHCGADADQR